jgi:hypothetical protein
MRHAAELCTYEHDMTGYVMPKAGRGRRHARHEARSGQRVSGGVPGRQRRLQRSERSRHPRCELRRRQRPAGVKLCLQRLEQHGRHQHAQQRWRQEPVWRLRRRRGPSTVSGSGRLLGRPACAQARGSVRSCTAASCPCPQSVLPLVWAVRGCGECFCFRALACRAGCGHRVALSVVGANLSAMLGVPNLHARHW